MQLTTFERLILLNILPGEGDITTLRILRDLKASLSFSEDEHKALEFRKAEDGRLEWKTDADKVVEMEIGVVAQSLIKKRLMELNEQKKLRQEHIPIYERFVEEK